MLTNHEKSILFFSGGAATLVVFALFAVLLFVVGSPAYGCTTDSECEALTGIPYDVAMQPNPPEYPTLVGFGCEGTIGAPIYAFEEDHFPKCKEIRAMNWEKHRGNV